MTFSLPSHRWILKSLFPGAATLILAFLVSVRQESIPHPLNKGSLGSWDMIGIVFYLVHGYRPVGSWFGQMENKPQDFCPQTFSTGTTQKVAFLMLFNHNFRKLLVKAWYVISSKLMKKKLRSGLAALKNSVQKNR